jgi:quercetin dioxygenase-like cupin family protein
MTTPEAVLLPNLAGLDLERHEQEIYDQPVQIRLLHEDAETGAEHYLVRYPAGMRPEWHTHTVAHTFVVLEGSMRANDELLGPGSYAHFPAGTPMRHGPGEGGDCLFVVMFHGPFDVALTQAPA